MELKVKYTGTQDSSDLPKWTVPKGTLIGRRAKLLDAAVDASRLMLIKEPDGKEYWLCSDGQKKLVEPT